MSITATDEPAVNRLSERAAAHANRDRRTCRLRRGRPASESEPGPRRTREATEALVDGRAVLAQEGYLPGERVLRRLNSPKLATALHKSGGATRFRELHNLPCRRPKRPSCRTSCFPARRTPIRYSSVRPVAHRAFPAG